MDTHQHLTTQECRRRAEEDVRAERTRIRRELLADLRPEIRTHRIPGSQTEVECVMWSDLGAALDVVCPEEED